MGTAYKLKDAYRVTRGYESPFLRNMIVQRAPEKHLSVWLRRPSGARTSLDLVFEDQPGAGEDGRSRRDRFFRGFSRLLEELESEDAFFFDDGGNFGRVGVSVFDRWERVELLDPDWAGGDSGRDARAARLGASRDDFRKHRPPPGCFHPPPLLRPFRRVVGAAPRRYSAVTLP